MAYSTVTEVRNYARGISAQKVPDTVIDTFIAAADSEIDELSGHSWIEVVGQIDYYDGTPFERLILDHRPVLALTEIAYRDTTPAWVALDIFDPDTGEGAYRLEGSASGLVFWTSAERPTAGKQIIRVTYNHGYADVPGYVSALSAIMAAIQTLGYAAGVTSPDGLVSINEGALSLSWGGGPYQDTITNLTNQANASIEKILKRRINYHPSRV